MFFCKSKERKGYKEENNSSRADVRSSLSGKKKQEYWDSNKTTHPFKPGKVLMLDRTDSFRLAALLSGGDLLFASCRLVRAAGRRTGKYGNSVICTFPGSWGKKVQEHSFPILGLWYNSMTWGRIQKDPKSTGKRVIWLSLRQLTNRTACRGTGDTTVYPIADLMILLSYHCDTYSNLGT